jgi:hypothetical protein
MEVATRDREGRLVAATTTLHDVNKSAKNCGWSRYEDVLHDQIMRYLERMTVLSATATTVMTAG